MFCRFQWQFFHFRLQQLTKYYIIWKNTTANFPENNNLAVFGKFIVSKSYLSSLTKLVGTYSWWFLEMNF